MTSGGYNADGRSDVGVFHNTGQNAEGMALSSLYTFSSNGAAFNNSQQQWISSGGFSWDKSYPASGDYNGDGKADLGGFCDAGTTADGRKADSLSTFLREGTTFQAPGKRWSGSVNKPCPTGHRPPARRTRSIRSCRAPLAPDRTGSASFSVPNTRAMAPGPHEHRYPGAQVNLVRARSSEERT
ncbi:FG-GAP repeat domain-containing protein [Streptomyces sp. NPDC017448]|uniref:FG-GAP repeat domain-containing protein n=1 Tax=Streptomyces sp. NPDC017448 TaxID=3364996 RepID=UPI00378FFF76